MTRRTALVGGLAAAGMAAFGVRDASAGTPGPRPAAAAVDVTTTAPTVYATVHTWHDVPCQCIGVDPATGEIYTVQDDRESSIVCRLTPDGKLLDWQTLLGAPHLVQVGVERDGDGVYIWGSWMKPASDGPVPAGLPGAVSFPFRWRFSGQSYAHGITASDPTVQRVPNLDGGVWQEFSIDQANDLVTMRIIQHLSETLTTYVLRTFSQLKAGVGARLGTLSIPNVRATWGAMQGQATCDGYLYAAFGGGTVGNPGYQDPVLVRIGWQDRTLAAVNLRSLNSAGGATGTYVEVEGVTVAGGHVLTGILSEPGGWASQPGGWVNTVWQF